MQICTRTENLLNCDRYDATGAYRKLYVGSICITPVAQYLIQMCMHEILYRICKQGVMCFRCVIICIKTVQKVMTQLCNICASRLARCTQRAQVIILINNINHSQSRFLYRVHVARSEQQTSPIAGSSLTKLPHFLIAACRFIYNYG